MYVETGYMDVDDDVAFRTHAKVCNCFGHSYKQFYPGMARHPVETGLWIWFPKLYDNPEWQNSISEDEEIFYERSKNNNAEHFDGFLKAYRAEKDIFKRLVFAHERDSSGKLMYRFKGLYVIDAEESVRTGTVTYRRKAKRVKTYAPSK
ncbi:MAG TPA: hypothetical protein VKB12_05330 [Pyrinomonadaceae bacterium]|nr:hypothetical protein [Pyrinomonadaceae bacterium]